MTGRHVVMAALLGADEYSLRHRGDDRRGLHHAAGLPPGHLQARRRHPAAPPAGQLHRARPRAWPPTCCSWPRRSAAIWPASASASLDEAIGRVDCCASAATGDARVDCCRPRLRSSPRPSDTDAPRHFVERVAMQDPRSRPRRPAAGRRLPPGLGRRRDRAGVPITNADRSVGAALGGAIALEYGDAAAAGHGQVRFTARPARASAPSSPTASSSSWSARPTTTSARAWAAGASSSVPPRRRRRLDPGAGRQHLPLRRHRRRAVRGRLGRRALRRAQLGRRPRWWRASATTAAST